MTQVLLSHVHAHLNVRCFLFILLSMFHCSRAVLFFIHTSTSFYLAAGAAKLDKICCVHVYPPQVYLKRLENLSLTDFDRRARILRVEYLKKKFTRDWAIWNFKISILLNEWNRINLSKFVEYTEFYISSWLVDDSHSVKP